MSDWDIEQIADAYLVDPDDRPLDDARYDPLAADTADEHEVVFDVEFIAGAIADAFADPCETCGDSRIIHVPDPTSSAYFPKPDRTYRCPDCQEIQ